MLNYIFLLAAISQIYGYNEPRIQNGVITPPDLFQFTVRVQRMLCTGSIISKRHVLTAAHCIDSDGSLKIEYDRYRVYLRVPYFAELRPLDSIHDHLKMPISIKVYIPKLFYYQHAFGSDFAIEPVKLAKDYLEKEGDEAYIAGFGPWWRDDNGTDSGLSSILRHTKFPVVYHCIGTLQICGGNWTHRALPGDSGGPMLIHRNNKWYQTGVSAATGGMDYRTRVSSYCSFIEEVTKNEVKCESIYPKRNNIPLLPLKHFEPLYKGQSTPLKLFDFVVPLYNYYYNQGCSATVISKRHLLTNGWCVYQYWRTNEYTKIQPVTHSFYKTITGILFPDLRSKKVESNLNKDPIDVTAYFPLNYKWPDNHNLAVIEFPEDTDFGIEPVTLPKDYFHIYLKNQFIIAGYGKYEKKADESLPPKLEHSNMTFQVDASTDRVAVIDNEKLLKDEGGPTLIERNGKFYQMGINFYQGAYNGSRTMVSADCDFIEEVTKKEVKCESLFAPLYEMPPYQPTPQNEDKTVNPESTNNLSTLVELNMLFLIFILISFYL